VLDEFRATGYDPEGYTLYTYAAVQVWKDAVIEAGALDQAKIEDELRALTFNTVIGKIKIDAGGDVVDPSYVWYVWHDGRYAEQR
jgi:branched-chain amino acid transport system substrate-binding protein